MFAEARWLGVALSVLAAVGAGHAGTESIKGTVDWPEQWVVFLPVDPEAPSVSTDLLTSIPNTLEVGGQEIERTYVEVRDNTYELARLFGAVESGNTAYVFLELDSDERREVTLGMGADWYLQAWVNGEEVLNTIATGNEHWPPSIADHQVNVTLEQGQNVLAVRFVSGRSSSVLALGGPDELRDQPDDEFVRIMDPVRGMNSFMERHGRKPYEMFWRDEGMVSERVIFEDRDYGTEIWLVDNSPTTDHAHTASVWSPWNIDGSRFRLAGWRPDREGAPYRGWLFDPDFTRLRKFGGADERPLWHPEKEDIYYIHRTYSGEPSVLYRGDVSTGELAPVTEWDRYPRERSYGFTRDGQYIFLDTPNGGMWLTYEPDEDDPIPGLGLYAGRPDGPPWENGQPPRRGSLFERGNAGRDPTVQTDEWGPLIRVRVGKLIDVETGEVRHVIAPLSGNRQYLQAYRDGRIDFPEGDEWKDVEVLQYNNLLDLAELYKYLPVMTHGHESPDPQMTYFARDGGTNVVHEFNFERKVDYDFHSYHMHWYIHPRFFVSWTRGWQLPTLHRPEYANVIHQAFSDGTFQPIVNSKHRFNGYYRGGDFTMQSPDATKINYGSSMTGRFRNYVAVMSRPRAPQNVQWEAEDQAVALSWTEPAYAREIEGYLVYRSERSGDGYELLTDEPVEQTAWRDATTEPGKPYYYVVTSLERSGLESGYSNEAAGGGVDLTDDANEPLVIYAEAEASIRDLDTDVAPGLAQGVDREHASDWYYVYRHPENGYGQASLDVTVPAEDDYDLWLRVRRSDADEAARWRVSVGGHNSVSVEVTDQAWHWVRASTDAWTLSEGQTTLTLATGDEAAQIDLICLAGDPDFEPTGPRPEGATPPGKVTGLAAENVRSRVNQLTWQASNDPRLSHYNVYSARDPFEKIDQRYLIASPSHPEVIDWGLRADTRYYYAVTAVDRRRNESEPVFVQAATPARQTPERTIELTFADADAQGGFKRSEAGGLRGDAYLVPEGSGSRVSWEVEVPDGDEYYLWLRYLHRGDGSRGGEVEQQVRASLNGESLTTLGGGMTDFNATDELIEPGHPMAEHVWTWAWPGEYNLEGVRLEAGFHTLTLENLHDEIRYDALLLTNEPSFVPGNGRLRQRNRTRR